MLDFPDYLGEYRYMDNTAQAPTATPVPTPPPPQPTSMPQPMQQPIAPAGKNGGFNFWKLIGLILLLAIVGGGAYALGKGLVPIPGLTGNTMYQLPTVAPTISHAPAILLSPTVASSPSASAPGTITGTLCYPASMIPKGKIVAKNTTTNQLTTQAYPGTQNGGGTTYTLSLTPGVYYLKFSPTDYPTVIGYYTDYSSCVGNPSGTNCSGQKTRPLLPTTVASGTTTKNVNLCDYYYPPSSPPVF